jgi:glycosyltransferase involved in cell wall biosynthesis
MQLMGAKMGHLRDRTNQYLINQPSRYITISDSMADFLRERGVTVPIDIVPNGVPAPKTPNSQLPTTLPSEQCTLGMLGRIEFKQKQQNFMVRTFIDLPDQFKNCHLLIAGSGPDQEKLKKLIQKKDNITLLPWQGDTEAFYSAIDFLMLPSRFEGVPLVMLEALARGIPVIGSRRDGMQDLLPEAWTFQPGKEELLAQTYSKARLSWKDSIDPLQEMVQTKMSIPAFQQKFHEALLERD